MTDRRPAAPIDDTALDAVLAPFGHSHMLPREAYVDEAVLAWEKEAFFQGGWVCAAASRTSPSPAINARS